MFDALSFKIDVFLLNKSLWLVAKQFIIITNVAASEF